MEGTALIAGGAYAVVKVRAVSAPAAVSGFSSVWDQESAACIKLLITFCSSFTTVHKTHSSRFFVFFALMRGTKPIRHNTHALRLFQACKIWKDMSECSSGLANCLVDILYCLCLCLHKHLSGVEFCWADSSHKRSTRALIVVCSKRWLLPFRYGESLGSSLLLTYRTESYWQVYKSNIRNHNYKK